MPTLVKHLYDTGTATLTYLAWDPNTKDAVVIDPVWNFDYASGNLSEESHQELTKVIHDEQLKLHAVIETHVHADHITGASLIKRDFPSTKVCISKHITTVQKTFASLFNIQLELNGQHFDILADDGEIFQFGSLKVQSIATPGHTPACTSFLINDEHIFTGDTLFYPDSGTGRCDFPGGDATTLFHSIQKIYELNSTIHTYTGHDYMPGGRELCFQSSIGHHREHNIHLKSDTSEKEFVEFRTNRDAGLNAPKLLLPSLLVNIKSGELPQAEENGVSYLKIPLKVQP